LYALIADEAGEIILHSEQEREGSMASKRPLLSQLLSRDFFRRFQVLYEGGRTYEVVLPMSLNNRPFGSVRLGVSTSFLRRELVASLEQDLVLAGVALPVSWLVAMALANLALKPIRRFTREMERLRRGEFEVGGDFGPADEFKELAAELQLLGQQLQADRLKMLSEKAPLQHVVDQLEDGLIFLNRDHKILFFNKAAEAVIERSVEEVLGQPLEDVLEPSHPLRPLLAQGAEGTVGFRNRTIALPQNGKSREFLVSAFSVTDAQKTMGAMVLLKDLDSIKTFQSLISYSARLTALGRLTSGVAHEMKNPLNAMMIHLELLKEKLKASSEGVRENLEVIESEIKRLDRAVLGFLKFARPQELMLRPVGLNALLQNIVTLLEAEWQKAGIRFAFQPASSLPSITGDEEPLHQAFLNILLNACQAMPTGGTVRIATEVEGRGTVKVTIADEGVGIPSEDLEKIFALYYTTKPEGSGIGLSLVYRTVQLHDGSIDVSSEIGRGTTATIRFPVG
jgi:PAS domain S-box-containing protein